MTPPFTLLLLGALAGAPTGLARPAAPPTLDIVSGVTATGEATAQWLAMLRRRLDDARYDSAAAIVKPLTAEERRWEALVRSRVTGWIDAIPGVASTYAPVAPPAHVTIVLGNRGAEDAFTHDPVTIGLDLAALQANYGDASDPENIARLDRFFRHEYVHLMQKALRHDVPYVIETPLHAALAEIWAEGLGNRESLSERWRPRDGRPSEATARALADLEPRFVARLAALACATPEQARPLTADLSWGRFDRKWGALPAALWLDAESRADPEALRRFVGEGPDGVWTLAARHLAPPLRAVLAEAQRSAEHCRDVARPGVREGVR